MSNNNETDIKDCCGAFAEIGSIIRPDDTELTFVVSADSEAALETKKSELKVHLAERFADAEVKMENQADNHAAISIVFSCTAEKMIFEMNLRHLMA